MKTANGLYWANGQKECRPTALLNDCHFFCPRSMISDAPNGQILTASTLQCFNYLSCIEIFVW